MVTSFNEDLTYIRAFPSEDEIREMVAYCLTEAGEAFGALEAGWDYKVKLRKNPPYPETVVVGPGKVCINLTTCRSRVGYVFEAGHEAVHCLNPCNNGENLLEEAVAVAFSLKVTEEQFGRTGLDCCELSENYKQAVRLAAAIDDDIMRLGQRLRGQVGNLRKVEPATIKELYPDAPELIVRQILETFPRRGPNQ